MIKLTAAFALAMAVAVLPAGAQQQLPPPGAPVPAAAVPGVPQPPTVDLDAKLKALSTLGKPDGEYKVGPGDLLEVSVFGVDDFRHQVRVASTGFIRIPLLDPVKVEGYTVAELEQQIKERLADEVIKDAQVTVFVKEYRSQAVSVLGAVRTPGQYQMSVQLRIVDALSLAGGLQSGAGDEAVIQRTSANGAEELVRVNLRALLEQGELTQNVPLRAGDVINVRERVADTIFILGEVNRAGAFVIPPRQDLRVTQVFAWAGGPMKTAKLSKAILLRYTEKGERQEVPVNFTEILKGKSEDFMVRANDIIFVPGSKFKDLGYSLLSGLPGTLASLPFRIP